MQEFRSIDLVTSERSRGSRIQCGSFCLLNLFLVLSAGAVCLSLSGLSFLSLRNVVLLFLLLKISEEDLTSFRISNRLTGLCFLLWLMSGVLLKAGGPSALPLSAANGGFLLPGLWKGFLTAGTVWVVSSLTGKIMKQRNRTRARTRTRTRRSLALGGGDIRLFFIAGLYLSAERILFMILLSCVLGLVHFTWLALGKRTGNHSRSVIPFGPSICTALGLMLF